FQTTVGNSNQILRHRHTDWHAAIGFIGAMIFVGPPDTGADTLAGGDDEWIAKIVPTPGYATDPRRILTDYRNAFVKYFDRILDALGNLFFEHYPIDISLAFEFELRVPVRDLCNR